MSRAPRAALPFLVLGLALSVAACDSSPSVVEADSTVTVAYRGELENGTVFDQSSRATFEVRRTIPGFQAGLLGMAVGETKTFTVPPEDGYGDQPVTDGSGNVVIPANSTLIFEVTVLGIR